jgi:hypothetical protein
MPIVTVFQAPTIAELAVEVSRYQMQQWNSDSMLDMLTQSGERQEKSRQKNGSIQKQKRN